VNDSLVIFLEQVARKLDHWATASERFGLSAYQMEAQRKLAEECRRKAIETRQRMQRSSAE